ncbi:MAG: response regulator transcription factor [Bacteroidaceae bacterium]|jgi:DNA-binding CsgD family transcriptional regulator
MRSRNFKFTLFPDFPTCQKEHCDYRGVDELVATTEQIDSVTVSGFVLLDFCNREVLYHSPRIGFLPFSVQTLAEWTSLSQEVSFMQQVNRAYWAFLDRLPAEERLHCVLSGNILFSENNYFKQVFQNIKPLRLDSSGNIFLLLCTFNYPERSLLEFNPRLRYRERHYRFEHGQWKEESLALNFREKRILRLSIQGLSQSEIALRICLSVDSVKKIRQQLFEKLEVSNIHDAIHVAENQRLF